MWSDHEYDDDTFMDYAVDLDRSERPNPKNHNRESNTIKTSQHYVAGLIPWYTSGFE
jgi:hypothetical protein